MPVLLRARSRLGPRRHPHDGRARRRPVDPQRLEDLEHRRLSRRLGDVPGPHRLGRPQAPRPHLVRGADRRRGRSPSDRSGRSTATSEFCEEFLDDVAVDRRRRDRRGQPGLDVAQTMLVYERGAGESGADACRAAKARARPGRAGPQSRADRRPDRPPGDRPGPHQRLRAVPPRTAHRRPACAARRLREPGVAAYGKLAAGVLAPLRARLGLEIGGPRRAAVGRAGAGDAAEAGHQLPQRPHDLDRGRHQRGPAQRHRRAGARPAAGADLRLPHAVQRGAAQGARLERQGRLEGPVRWPLAPRRGTSPTV